MKYSSHILLTVTKTKCSHGVTLIEMLVALVILTLIVGSVYVAFDSGKQSWQVGDTLMQKYQNARGALDMMSREISAMYITISNVYATGLIYDGVSSGNGFRFVASIPRDTEDWDLRKVCYRYDDGDKEIERSFLTDFTDLTYPSSWSPLISNVNSLGFRCWDGSSWEESGWDSTSGGSQDGEIPKAVEITITVQDEKQLSDERTFRTVVHIPRSEQ